MPAATQRQKPLPARPGVPTTPRDRFNARFSACFQQGRWHEALHLCGPLLERDAEDIDALLKVAGCLNHAGDRAAAIDTLRRILAIDPQSDVARDNLHRLERAARGECAAPLISFDLAAVSRRDGRYTYISEDLFSTYPDIAPTSEKLAEIGMRFYHLLERIGPFYAHFGGVGDALLLLATFLDEDPHATVVSFANSHAATRSFLDAFPSLSRVIFLPEIRNNYGVHEAVRVVASRLPNCQGMGVTPVRLEEEWRSGLHLVEEYGVTLRPAWAAAFRTDPRPRQVAVSPRGSMCGMVGTKRNVIDPLIWPDVIRDLQDRGLRPVILGTPPERDEYPSLAACEDRRSFSFREQMDVIANSAMLVGADSWAKTFSALIGLPTLVFDPLKGPDWHGTVDPSEQVFIRPWDCIQLVKNLDHFRSVLAGMTWRCGLAKKMRREAPALVQPCGCCGGALAAAFDGKVRGRIPVTYYQCGGCGSLQLPEPHWLDEAYGVPLSPDPDQDALSRSATVFGYVCCVRDQSPPGSPLRHPRSLDFGAGRGYLLRLMLDDGLEAWGYDRYPAPVLAEDHVLCELPEGPFDLITAIEVLERVTAPVEMLHSLRARLSPGGVLMVSAELFDSEQHDAQWPGLGPEQGQRVTFATREGLEAAAREAGLRVAASFPHRGADYLHMLVHRS